MRYSSWGRAWSQQKIRVSRLPSKKLGIPSECMHASVICTLVCRQVEFRWLAHDGFFWQQRRHTFGPSHESATQTARANLAGSGFRQGLSERFVSPSFLGRCQGVADAAAVQVGSSEAKTDLWLHSLQFRWLYPALRALVC